MDDGLAGSGALSYLIEESRLADSGLAEDRERRPVALAEATKGSISSLEFGNAADDAPHWLRHFDSVSRHI